MISSVKDSDNADLHAHFDEVSDFISSAEKAKPRKPNVLVHSLCGVSRSSTLAIAYLMKEKKFSYEEAEDLLLSKRRRAFPNIGFRAQLLQYSLDLK